MGKTKFVRFYMRCTNLSALVLSIVATAAILAAIIGPFAAFATASAASAEERRIEGRAMEARGDLIVAEITHFPSRVVPRD